MNIVHTESSLGWGGQEIRILEEARGLIGRGHDVQLICPREARIYTEAARYGVPVHALSIGRKNLKGLLALRRWLKSHRVAVINTHSSTDSWLAAIACASLRGAPPIVRTRHISTPVHKNIATRWLYGEAVKHVVTTGEVLREILIRDLGLAPESVTSVPTGIDTTLFVPGDKAAVRRILGLDPDEHYIGIVATLRSWKGHHYLLEAFRQLSIPGWKLLIIGDGPQKESLKDKVHQLGLGSQVIFTGQQNNPEQWLQALDIFCLPSYANEGVPQAILQAMLTALPIVTTPVGAILEAIQHEQTGLIVEPKNSQQLQEAINRLLHDVQLCQALGSAARKRAQEKFGLDTMLDRMEPIFREAEAGIITATTEKHIRINLGCGNKYIEGFIGVDRSPCLAADILCDIARSLPFRDNSVDEFYLDNLIEHVPDIPALMAEVVRTSTNNAKVTIITPHFTSLSSWKDPTHLHHLSYFSFDHFERISVRHYTGGGVKIAHRHLSFGGGLLGLIGRIIFSLSPEAFEKKYCFIFRASTLRFELQIVKC